jgi:hypothetical protein
MLFSQLPEDIIHHILSYDTAMKYRNGKYMIQIAPTDPRYDMLTQRIVYPRNKIYHMNRSFQLLAEPYNNIIKLAIYYRPFDIYWSITIHPDTVNYQYSLNLDNKYIDTTFQFWVRK